MTELHPGVRVAMFRCTEKFEGSKNFPYLDIRGFVTTGLGCLIDPKHLALSLPWVHDETERRLDVSEVAYYWRKLKALPFGSHIVADRFREETHLRLTDEGVDELFNRRLDANVEYLEQLFSDWLDWPADAQLGTLLVAWYTGCGFDFPEVKGGQPQLLKTLEANDWMAAKAAAASHAFDVDRNPGLTPRLIAVQICFDNATHAVQFGGWPRLHYPTHYMPSRGQRTLRLNMAGADVVHLRHHLCMGSLDELGQSRPDFFDLNVSDAVRAIQATHGLVSDGIVGPKTRKAIGWPTSQCPRE